MGWTEVGGFVLGVLVTILFERSFDFVSSKMGRSYRTHRGRQRTRKIGTTGALIRRGDECIHVVQFVPGGWQSDHISFLEIEQISHEHELGKANIDDLPAPVETLVDAIREYQSKYGQDGFTEAGEWDGPGLAVLDINTNLRYSDDEEPGIRFTVAPTQYSVAQALGNAWEQRFLLDLQTGDKGFQERFNDPDFFLRPIPGMLNSIGLNAIVITNDDHLVLVKRSRYAASARSGYHNPINEGMLPSDRTGGALDPVAGILRGAEEELGLQDIPRESVSFHSAIYDVRRYQFGLLGMIDLRRLRPGSEGAYTSDQILQIYQSGLAKDRYENRSIEIMRWGRKNILEMLAKPEWIEHGRLNLALTAAALEPSFSKSAEFLKIAANVAGVKRS